jgi:hypothetical protein
MSSIDPSIGRNRQKKQEFESYRIPLRFRRMENLHIIFWLFKDLSWCLLWKPLGLIMILPTLYFAIHILIQTRRMISEFCHNLAVVFWITANSYWMITEFLGMEDNKAFAGISTFGLNDISYKNLAVIPFGMGIAVLVYYYLFWRIRNRDTSETL